MNFADIFYNAMEKTERKPSSSVSFAPSYLTDCARKIYYKKTGTEMSNPADLPARFKMMLGTLAHEGLQKILADEGLLIEAETLKEHTLPSGIKMYYRLDGIVKDGDGKAIIEIKTKYGAGMDYVKDAPSDDHLVQTVCYLVFEKMTKAYIIYVGRDNGYLFQHKVELKNGIVELNGNPIDLDIESYFARLDGIKEMIESKTLPARDYEIVMKKWNALISFDFIKDKVKYKSDWRCEYCSYKDQCWSAEIEAFKKSDKNFYIKGEML
jgi:CRISPR/Cas system-associated exonuclease Cas4 (RecB family)